MFSEKFTSNSISHANDLVTVFSRFVIVAQSSALQNTSFALLFDNCLFTVHTSRSTVITYIRRAGSTHVTYWMSWTKSRTDTRSSCRFRSLCWEFSFPLLIVCGEVFRDLLCSVEILFAFAQYFFFYLVRVGLIWKKVVITWTFLLRVEQAVSWQSLLMKTVAACCKNNFIT